MTNKRFAHWIKEANPYWDWRLVEIIPAGDIREGGVILPLDCPPVLGRTFCHSDDMAAALCHARSPMVEVWHRVLRMAAKAAAPEGYEVPETCIQKPLIPHEGLGGLWMIEAHNYLGDTRTYQVNADQEDLWVRVWNARGCAYLCLDYARFRQEERRAKAAAANQGLLASDAIANNAGVKLSKGSCERLTAHGIVLKGPNGGAR